MLHSYSVPWIPLRVSPTCGDMGLLPHWRVRGTGDHLAWSLFATRSVPSRPLWFSLWCSSPCRSPWWVPQSAHWLLSSQVLPRRAILSSFFSRLLSFMMPSSIPKFPEQPGDSMNLLCFLCTWQASVSLRVDTPEEALKIIEVTH